MFYTLRKYTESVYRPGKAMNNGAVNANDYLYFISLAALASLLVFLLSSYRILCQVEQREAAH